MRRGDLVPDEIVLNMVRGRARCLRCQGGFLFDGFPRSVAQAESLDRILADQSITLDAVVSYELSIGEVVARLSGRRTCRDCKAIFHAIARPPRVEGVCDHCEGELYQREDDRPEAIRVRLEVYEKTTAPVIDFYRKCGLLMTIQAANSPEETFQRTLTMLDQRDLLHR
jgi:adenylate kinase